MVLDYSRLFESARDCVKKSNTPLQAICDLLYKQVPHYNWVGFYFMDDATKTLHIGPYAGAKTEHIRIPYGKGICGQVAESGETFLSQNVAAEENYIACSIETKAELVVPMYRNNKLIGQIDIDSHFVNPFTQEDESFLKKICELVTEFV